MSIEPKIHTNRDLKKLEEYYVSKKMSTVDIEKNSMSLFGFYVSRGTIYKTLIKHSINVRNKSVSISRAMSTLNIDKSYLTEELMEWIDGFNLGDGYIKFRKGYSNARFIISSSTKKWTEYAMSYFGSYDMSIPKCYQKIDIKHPNPIWESRTKSHPDIIGQARRWYPDGKKHVPEDVRITPISILLWYLGDGSFSYTNEGNIARVRLATCSFDIEEVEGILIPKLKRLGLRCKRNKSKNDIRICSDSIRKFFDIIGYESPVSEYQYKFDIPEWLKLIRLSDIVKNDREKWRAQYYYKSGQVECIKSPGGKMLLFTEGQADKLKNKLLL